MAEIIRTHDSNKKTHHLEVVFLFHNAPYTMKSSNNSLRAQNVGGRERKGLLIHPILSIKSYLFTS